MLASLAVLPFSHRGAEGHLAAPVMFLAGAFLVGIATIGRIWCAAYIAGYKDGTLITIGPYSMCRNPLYLFNLIGVLGMGLATLSWSFTLLFVALFALIYPAVIRAEEERLRRLHGKAFDSYRREVPRFVPRLQFVMEPESYVIKPRVLRRHLGDVLWLVWMLGIVASINYVHEHGMVPAYFTWW